MTNNNRTSANQETLKKLTADQEKFIHDLKCRLRPEIEKKLLLGERLNPVQKRIANNLDFTPEMISLLIAQHGNPSAYELSEQAQKSIEVVRDAAQKINQGEWNYYSNALSSAAAAVFETSISCLSSSFKTINYLEIGSCQGLSMSLIALLIEQHSSREKLVSIDPYFENEYIEGAKGIWGIDQKVAVNKVTRNKALQLYKDLEQNVQLIEELSFVGLRALIQENQRFQLIYIDGSHEGINPLRDLGLAFEVIEAGGIIMLDDHSWPDVRQVKELCDQHCEKIDESWKIAAYRIHDPHQLGSYGSNSLPIQRKRPAGS